MSIIEIFSHQLLSAGIQPQNVNPIFTTHHHFDHIGNLGELLLAMWHNERTSQIDILGPNYTSEIVAALFGQVFKGDIPKSENLMDSLVKEVRKDYHGEICLGND